MKNTLNRQYLAAVAGIVLPNDVELLAPGMRQNFALAMDAQPGLITVSNSGIPAYLQNYMDPEVIEVLTAPMKAAVILGEVKKGDWTTLTATFPVVEYTGETSSYGDYSENGSAGANAIYPQRQSYHYQTMTQWGERELEMAGLAKLDWASRINIASILVLNKYQNLTYFFGVAGLQNYGLLNDPSLPAAITPTTKAAGGATWAAGTALEIYQDILNMFTQLQTQANGLVSMEESMTLAISPTVAPNLNKVTSFNVSVMDMIKKNFPKLSIETAPEYATQSGQLAQLIIKEFEGQRTASCAFTEKLRAHAIERKTSSFKQKKSQGSWGTIIWRPVFIAQMLGL